MATCLLYRNESTIEKVLAPNGQESNLYPELKKYVKTKGIQQVIQAVPYIQDRLADGSLLSESIPEVAAGLWSIVYTPEYQQFLNTLPAAVRDKNGEPVVDAFVNHILEDIQYSKPRVLSPDALTLVNRVRGSANELQKKIIDDLHLNPEDPIVFNEKDHTYFDLAGKQYFGIAGAISGGTVSDDNIYANAGSKVDKILLTIIENGKYEDIADIDLGEQLKQELWNNLSHKVNEWTIGGNVLLSQVVIADKESKRASGIDILLITPGGELHVLDLKTGKHPVYTKDGKLSQSYLKQWEVKKGSVYYDEESEQGAELSNYQKHGVQLGAYRKILAKKGYDVAETRTFHLGTHFAKNVLDGVQLDTNNEVLHYWGENQELVDKIIVGEVPTPYKQQEYLNELGPEWKPEVQEDAPDPDELFTEPVEKVLRQLEAREEYLKKQRSPDIYVAGRDTVQELSELIIGMRTTANRGEQMQAYTDFLKHAMRKAKNFIAFMDNEDNQQKKEYLDIIANGEQFLRVYENSLTRAAIGPVELQSTVLELSKTLEEAAALLDIKRQDFVLKQLVLPAYEGKADEQRVLEALRDDIGLWELYAEDLAQSRNPALATMAKLRRDAQNKAQDEADEFRKYISELGNQFLKDKGIIKSTDKTFEFMQDGQGNYVGKFGYTYKELRRKAFELTKDELGNKLEYIQDATTQQQLDHNIDLWGRKQQQRAFTTAEVSDVNGFEDGQYHKYTDAFKAIRDKYEFQKAVKNDQGDVMFWTWEKKDSVSEEDFEKYVRKYYDQVTYMSMIFHEGQPTGQLQEKVSWFPRREYTEPRDFSSDGKDMRDSKWVKLQEPKTADERINSEFYKKYMDAYRSMLDRLPLGVAEDMANKSPRVRKDGSFVDNLKYQVSSIASLRVNTDNRKLNDDGLIDDSIPILYVGDTRNNKKIATLESKLEALKTEVLPAAEKKDKKRRLTEALNIEKGKIDVSEMETDPIRALSRFAESALMYQEMSKIEAPLKAIIQTIEDTKFKAKNADGKLLKKGEVQGKNSNSYKRGVEWLALNYYQNDPLNRSKVAQRAQKFMNLTSLTGVAFNVFGSINNYMTARVNADIEAIGGKYFSKTAALNARKSYWGDYLSNRLRNMPSKEYDVRKPRSKYEAVVDHFRMFSNPNKDAGRVDLMSLGYALQEGGEYLVQSQTGVAYVMDQDVKSTVDPTVTKKLYDIFTYDPNTGELVTQEGWDFSAEDLNKVRDTIFNINKVIQGNYAKEDRVMLQKHWLGNLAMQFHKHIAPAIRARFGKHYVDLNLGDTEGRYYTAVKFLANLWEFEGSFKEKWAEAINNMRPDQIANLRKDVADVGYFMLLLTAYAVLSKIGDSVDDDDEQLQRLVNFMKYQDSRSAAEMMVFVPVLGIQEQWQLIKSPIPALNTARQWGELLKETAYLPFPPYDNRIYQRGVHKGELKVSKELIDVLPAINTINKWQGFSTVQAFYIK